MAHLCIADLWKIFILYFKFIILVGVTQPTLSGPTTKKNIFFCVSFLREKKRKRKQLKDMSFKIGKGVNTKYF